MRVFLTGATSFTGAHVARAFRDAGCEVAASLSRRLTTYSDPLVQRRREHAKVTEWVEDAPFGSPRMLEYLASARVDVFVNHGAAIKGYRNADFDFLACAQSGLQNLGPLLETLVKGGASRVIHSGSIYEADEGEASMLPAPSAEAISPYGVAKGLVWQPLRYFAVKAGLGVSKIVIPNPVGSLENDDRMVPFFVRAWKSGSVPSLRTPQLVRDNVPAPWLARFYVEEARANRFDAQKLTAGASPVRVRRPSAYALTNENFLKTLVKHFQAATGRNLPFEVSPQPSEEPAKRVNTEVVPELMQEDLERKFWQDWAASFGKW